MPGSEALLRWVEDGKIQWGRDMDCTRYDGSKRSTLNGSGVAKREDVEKKFSKGCSVRLLRPHEHSKSLQGLLRHLEVFFGSGGGTNTYWTPAGSQG